MATEEHPQERRREAMVSAAYRLFRDRGYESTTVEDIAAAAGVSPRTFYRYFTSKDAVLAARGVEVIDDVVDRVSAMPTAQELLRTYAAVVRDGMEDDDFDLVVWLLRENAGLLAHARLWRYQWSERLAEGLSSKQGHDTATTECRLTSIIVVEVVNVALDRWLQAPGPRDIEALVREVAEVAERQFAHLAW